MAATLEGRGLPELLDALRYRWKLAALIAVPVFLGAALYAQSLPAQYDGVALVAVRPESASVSADTVRVLAPTYVAYITAPATVNRVAPSVGLDGPTLEKAVDATVASDTGNVTIRVRLASVSQAVNAANTLGRQLVTFAVGDPLLTAQVIAPATTPTGPSGPPRKLIDAAALLVGLVLGLALASVVERSRPRVRTWRDIAMLTGQSVVGRIPNARALRVHPGGALADPAVGAAVRTLRTNLERELGSQPKGLIVVTSALPGEGKTTTAGLFATALARLDANVLLVDADLRRPGLNRGLVVGSGGGLSGVLKGQQSLDDAVVPGWAPDLSILPTAPDPDAGDLLARHFADVVRQARERFDVIIVDCPPLLGTDDARTLATMADGVLLVVETGSRAEPVSEAMLALNTLRARVVGVVANRTHEGGSPGYHSSAPYGA